MRVERISMERFRGISTTGVEQCGDLNVLIGKNNSGKSTILAAINGYFEVLAGKSIVAVDAGLCKSTNVHKASDGGNASTISVELSFTQVEMRSILDGILSESPQMKNALEGVDHSYTISVCVTSVPEEFSYVSQIDLLTPASATESRPKRTLLAVPQDAARELKTRQDAASHGHSQARALESLLDNFDPDDFHRLKREDGPRSFVSRRYQPSLARLSDVDVDDLIRRSESYLDFRRTIESLAQHSIARGNATLEELLECPVDTFSGSAEAIPAYAFNITNLIGSITVLHLGDRREPVGPEEAKRLLALKVRRGGPEVLRNIQQTVESLLGVNIDAFESQAIARAGRPESRAEMDVDEVLVEMNGAGIREALRLILDNELGAPNLLLVEEPEVHLHPALEISMLRYLKEASEKCQIFVTTHSTNFLDTGAMKNVYLVRKSPWVTASLIDYEEAEHAIPSELGLRLSSLFMFDRLLFVEGPSDEAILRELGATAGINFGQDGVGFVAMGSSRNFTHYANQATIEFLTKRRVQMTFVLDRDEATQDEVGKLVSRLDGSATLHVLEKRELENYLATPKALLGFISEKRQLAGLAMLDTSVEEMTALIGSKADSLRSIAVNKRVIRALGKPIHVDRRSVVAEGEQFAASLRESLNSQRTQLEERIASIDRQIEAETQYVDQAWESRKLHIVPGDELIDAICGEFEVRYKKERDGGRLARHLDMGEIAPELVRILRAAAS